MKKRNLFLGMFAMTSMLVVTSCSQDELVNNPMAEGDYITAQFTLDTPDGIATRVIGDGTKADVVACAVFDESGAEMTSLRQTVNVTGKKATYNVRLVKGQEYRIAFFAYNEAAAAYDVTDMKNIKVNPNQASNIENRDAFTAYTVVTAEESMQSIDRDVTLYRPFAQLNLGAYKDDIAAAASAGVVVTNSQIKVSNVYTAFNAYDDVVTGETSEVTFAMNGIPTEDLEVDINEDETISDDEKFEYLALNYLLVGDMGSEKSLTDVEFVWKTADNKTNEPTTVFKNIPVQRNYRTNIIGYLLTNPAQFNIFIDEEFQKPDYIVSTPWDGISVKEPATNADGAYMVATPDEWAWFANKTFAENTTVEILGDIDMNGGDFMMLQNTKEFTINGNGYTIKNINAVKSTSKNDNGGAASVSLFYPVKSSKLVINDLTFTNVKAHNEFTDWYGHNAAVIASYAQGDIELNNVHVYNADVKAMEGVGVLIGIVTSESEEVKINNCSVNDSKVSNLAVAGESGFAAAMIGKVNEVTVTFTGENSINNTTINAYYASNRGENSIDWVAVKRLDGAVITGIETVTVNGGSMTKIGLDQMDTVSSSAELTKAISEGKTIISLAEGTYNLPTSLSGKSIVLEGANKETTIIDMSDGGTAQYGANSVTFKNLTMKRKASWLGGLSHSAAEHYEDCIVEGTLVTYAATVTATRTNFVPAADEYYNVHLYAPGTMTFTECNFLTLNGRCVYAHHDTSASEYNLTFTDCKFETKEITTESQNVAAIRLHTEYGIHGTLAISNCTATGWADTHNGGLWVEWNNNTKEYTNLFTKTIN